MPVYTEKECIAMHLEDCTLSADELLQLAKDTQYYLRMKDMMSRLNRI